MTCVEADTFANVNLKFVPFPCFHTEHRGIHKTEGVCLNRKLIDTVANGGQLTHHFIELWVGLLAELIAPYHFS